MARTVVIGGGLAGLASAWALARRGRRVTLLEREPTVGRHASGRNAGLVRRVVDDPALAAVGRRGAALLRRPPPDLAAAPLDRRTGSILLAGGAAAGRLRAAADAARAAGVEVEVRPAREVRGRLLGLAPEPEDVAALTPEDGVADPGAVVHALLGAALRLGVEVRTGVEARVARAGAGGAVVEVREAAGAVAGDLDARALEADEVVLAAGPWAERLAREAGATPIPHAPLKRHLFFTGVLAPPPPADAAWVWDVGRGLYARPETGGLLLCACDEEPRPPEDAQPADDAAARLAAAVARVAPELAGLRVARAWAGLRTFAPDRRFVLGRDPAAPALVWASALGGHGLTAGLAVGELVAAAVLGEDDPLLAALGPARLEAVAAGGGPA